MWSIFGTTDEIVTGPRGSLSSKSKNAIYADGAWCGLCLKKGMRTWIDLDQPRCPTCKEFVSDEMRIID